MRRSQAGDADHYTLNVTGQPFWEVFRQLTEQHAIRLIIPRKSDDDVRFPDLVMMPAPTAPRALALQHKFVNGGDYRLQFSSVGRSENFHYLGLSWAVIADPRLRMHIERAEFPPLAHIIDDRGDEMKYLMPQRVASAHERPRGSLWPVHAQLQLPTNGATKIVSLQGVF